VHGSATAFAENPNTRVIVLNGGGNDILIPAVAGDPFNCLTGFFQFGRLSRRCQNFIDDIYVDAVDLLNTMARNGATDGIYLGYYYTKNGLLLVDNLEEAVDYGDLRLGDACRNSALSCTFIDPRRVIRDSDIVFDGVHPNDSGSRKLADLIWPILAPKL